MQNSQKEFLISEWFCLINSNSQKNAATGENRILVTIGTENKLENIEILKYTDQETRKSIETAFKLKELNTWESANIYGIPVKEKFEISIFIENKKITHY